MLLSRSVLGLPVLESATVFVKDPKPVIEIVTVSPDLR
jgi:hypothetical protein